MYWCLVIILIIQRNNALTSLESRTMIATNIDNMEFERPMNSLSRSDVPATTQSPKGTCYSLVGCFDNKYPFNNAAFEIPQSPERINTKFLFFGQESPNNSQSLLYDDRGESIANSRINASRWLRIVIHGFLNDGTTPWMINMKDELLTLKDNEVSDVILVDWGNGAKGLFYPNAAANTRLVGRQVGLLLEMIQKTKGISYDKVHCIGHSLGAHTCALASNVINNQLARISGLDPAGPLFEGKNNAVKLDISDAKFIDVIHSNADFKFGLNFGSAENSGHVDFYINGGENQAGCPSVGLLVGDVFKGQSSSASDVVSCSHSRSHDYFIESINSLCPFTGFPCDDYDSYLDGKCSSCSGSGCSRVGFHSIYSKGRGRMFLTTTSTSPFCGRQYLIEMELSSTMKTTEGDIAVAIYLKNELLTNLTLTAKAKSEIRSGQILRRVFVSRINVDKIDSSIVYFNKETNLLDFGSSKGDSIEISSIRLVSLESQMLLNGFCKLNVTVNAHSSRIIPVDHSNCSI